jgi:hypothetical protein
MSSRALPVPVPGNYQCLSSLSMFGFFGEPREYYLELARHIQLFQRPAHCLGAELAAVAVQVLCQLSSL